MRIVDLHCSSSDLEFEREPFPHQSGQASQDVGEIASRLALNGDGDHQKMQIVLADPAKQIVDRNFHILAERHLVRGHPEFGADGILHLAGDKLDGGRERVPDAKAADDVVQGVWKLSGETLDPFSAGPNEIQTDESRPDGQADDRCDPHADGQKRQRDGDDNASQQGPERQTKRGHTHACLNKEVVQAGECGIVAHPALVAENVEDLALGGVPFAQGKRRFTAFLAPRIPNTSQYRLSIPRIAAANTSP
jgi:hypothetical protein